MPHERDSFTTDSAKRLRRRITHLKPQADRCWLYFRMSSGRGSVTPKIGTSLADLECATLTWANLTRLKLVQAKIRRLTGQP